MNIAILDYKRGSISSDALTVEPQGPFSGKNSNKFRSGLWIENDKLYVSANVYRELDYRDLFHVSENVKKYNKKQESPERKFKDEFEQLKKLEEEIHRLENKLFGKKKAEQLRAEYHDLENELLEKKKKLEAKNKKIATEVSKLAQEINAVQLPSMKDDSYWVQVIPDERFEGKSKSSKINSKLIDDALKTLGKL